MGLGSAVRGGLGLLNARHHDIEAMPSNQTPAFALNALWHRPREMPLPLTPLAVLRSMVQLEDVQALLWAWMLVSLVLLIAFWSNPSDASFRPFLTDFTFRERLRCLHEGSEAAAGLLDGGVQQANGKAAHDGAGQATSTSGAIFKGSFFSTSPFATTFGTKLSLSVRTPPYSRKDLRMFSVVTISHSTPLHSLEAAGDAQPASQALDHKSATAESASDYTSVFIGAFGRWWTVVYGLPLQRLSSSCSIEALRTGQAKAYEREELEANRHELSDWGVLELRSADHEHAFVDPLAGKEVETAMERRRSSGSEPAPSLPGRQLHPKGSHSRSSSPHCAHRNSIPGGTGEVVDSSDITSLVTAVTESQAAVSDLQEQLKQLRANSAKVCEGLQGDVDELRAHKREEDKARMETKAKTKSLDDGKRQAEHSKREAERRFKAASNARTSKQNSIAAKRDEMEALRKKRAGHQAKLQSSSTRKKERIEELHMLTRKANERLEALKAEMDQLHASVETAEEALGLEKENLQAAYDGQPLREKDQQQHHHPHLPQQHHHPRGNGLYAPHAYRDADADPYGGLEDAASEGFGRGISPYDGFSGPYLGPPPMGLHQQPIGYAATAPYDPFGELPDASQAYRQFGPAIPDRVEEAPVVGKYSEGLGANVLRNAFQKGSGAGGFKAAGFAPRTANGVGVGAGTGGGAAAVAGASGAALEEGATTSNFEAMKQAFQPTLASDEEGRRSWSAFDMWQSDMRDARHRLQWANGLSNGSADSLPQFHLHAHLPTHSAEGVGSSTMLSPLDRSSSEGGGHAGYGEPGRDETGSSSETEQSRNLNKVKRAFRWPFRPSQIQSEVI